MKQIFKEIWMPWLTWKQRLIAWYFVLSFCSLCVGDETPLWIIGLVVLNFANAARLIRKVPFPDESEDTKFE